VLYLVGRSGADGVRRPGPGRLDHTRNREGLQDPGGASGGALGAARTRGMRPAYGDGARGPHRPV
jgi:hypothetical protein